VTSSTLKLVLGEMLQCPHPFESAVNPPCELHYCFSPSLRQNDTNETFLYLWQSVVKSNFLAGKESLFQGKHLVLHLDNGLPIR
jgi:hypothetical protein